MKLVQGISVFALAASGLMAQTVTPPPQVATTGLVGLAQEQRAQFNVLNLGSVTSTVQSVCVAVISFLGDDGGVLKTKTATMAPGQSAFIILDALSDLQLAVGQRKEIRAMYMVPAVPAPAATTSPAATSTIVFPPVCALIGTLEIIDVLSDQTHVVLGGMHAVPGSAPLN